MPVRSVIIACLALAGLLACTPQSPQSGKAYYRANCASCHGLEGKGDGPMAADLPVPPADLTMIAARNGGVFPIGDVMAAIHGYRGKAFAGVMPEFGALLDSEPVAWVDPEGRTVATPSALLDVALYLNALQQN